MKANENTPETRLNELKPLLDPFLNSIWDQAVELAYLVNASKYPAEQVVVLAIDVDDTASAYPTPTERRRPGQRLFDDATRESEEKSREKSLARLHEAVGALIGRDVYITGTNPHEFSSTQK